MQFGVKVLHDIGHEIVLLGCSDGIAGCLIHDLPRMLCFVLSVAFSCMFAVSRFQDVFLFTGVDFFICKTSSVLSFFRRCSQCFVWCFLPVSCIVHFCYSAFSEPFSFWHLSFVCSCSLCVFHTLTWYTPIGILARLYFFFRDAGLHCYE